MRFARFAWLAVLLLPRTEPRLCPPPPSHRRKSIRGAAACHAHGIHQALGAIIQALACGEIDSKRGGKLLYALQLAQKNLETMPSLAQNPAPVRPPTGP